MGRVIGFVAALAIGVLAGMAGAFLWLDAGSTAGPVDGGFVSSTTGSTVTTPTTISEPVTSTTSTTGSVNLLLVWTSGGLPDGFADAARHLDGVRRVSTVLSDLISVESVFDARATVIDDPADGWLIPVEVSAIDSDFGQLASVEWQPYLTGLGPGEAILSETSAVIRRATVGATIVSANGDLRVVAVLPDVVLGGAELVVSQETGEQIGVTTPRYLLISFDGDRARFEADIRSTVPVDKPTRVRALGETPFLRHGDAVLPQVLVKQAFGEFSIRSTSDGGFEIDPEWVDRHIFTTNLPLIGEAACHAGIVTQLSGALEEIERSNLGFLIETFDGCFNPRFIAGARSLSRHAWGAAVDVNYSVNPTGQVTVQDPRLVAVMETWGFTWGGNWLVPDAAHFEWVSSPGLLFQAP